MSAAFVFSFLGFAFGVIFDFVTAFEKALNNKWFTFAADFIMTVFFSVVYGCVMIAYSNGAFRGIYFLLSAGIFVIYLLTLRKTLFPIFCGIFSPIRKILKKISKKLKNNEKSFKKVLHLGK